MVQFDLFMTDNTVVLRQLREEYYQKIDDIFTTYLYFHLEVVSRTSLPYAALPTEFRDVLSSTIVPEFNADLIVNRQGGQGVDLITALAVGTKEVMEMTFDEFVNYLEQPEFTEQAKVPDIARPFVTAQLRRLYREAVQLGGTRVDSGKGSERVARFAKDDEYSFRRHGKAGIQSGTEQGIQLAMLLQDKFDVRYLNRLTKADISHAGDVAGEIGRPRDDHPLSYNLLDPTTIINKPRMKELGAGQAIGCPIGHQPTQETADALGQLGYTNTRTKMVSLFGQMMYEGARSYLLEWYENTSFATRDCLDPENRRIFDRVILQERGFNAEAVSNHIHLRNR